MAFNLTIDCNDLLHGAINNQVSTARSCPLRSKPNPPLRGPRIRVSCKPTAIKADVPEGDPNHSMLAGVRSNMAVSSVEASFRPALLVVDMQEDFCPPVSRYLYDLPQ